MHVLTGRRAYRSRRASVGGTGTLFTGPPSPECVYALELAGQDDAFAAAEAESAAAGVEVVAPGLATARGVTDRVRHLAFTHRASELVGRADADVAGARALLQAAPLDREGSVAVRARDVRSTAGIDTQQAERDLGAVLVERGFTVDLDAPDHELYALFSEGVSLLGWGAIESQRDFGARKPTDRPFFQPGSMDPMLARALVNLAGVGPGDRLLDPMCGTGGVLIEGSLVGADVLGTDAQRKMVRGTRQNLADALAGEWAVARADATRLPLPDTSVDAAVFDAPYGRQSKVEGVDPDTVVAGALEDAHRVAPRAVVVADRPLAGPAQAAGWTVERTFERRVHRSLVRHVHVLG
jgi:tRNA (guanine10-N2)-dimethyltransferase